MDKGMIIRTMVVGDLETNCYLLGSRKTQEAILIDPGAEADKIKTVVKEEGLRLNSIVLTHGHYDHIGVLDSFDVPVYVHEDDAEMVCNSEKNLSANFGPGKEFNPDLRILKDEQVISVGDLNVSVLHTPGHSPGGICLKVGEVLFSGDTLFRHGIGRTDLPGGSYEQLSDSINKKIMVNLSEKTLVLPGHGPATTIGEEKRENNFL